MAFTDDQISLVRDIYLCSAYISMISSIFALIHLGYIVFFEKKSSISTRDRTPFSRFVAAMLVFDFLAAASLVFLVFEPDYHNDQNSGEVCEVKGLFTYVFTLTSYFWTCIMALHCDLVLQLQPSLAGFQGPSRAYQEHFDAYFAGFVSFALGVPILLGMALYFQDSFSCMPTFAVCFL